ncbi:hypothetical protein [Burkholderia ubonensis]|uniref:hypothetical protein n=1 Tax=Burkholderia ubonensis TaxID=101571 RepID=UPI0012FDB05B|nr:hypothetical protein [Burkholderia ubonensis]
MAAYRPVCAAELKRRRAPGKTEYLNDYDDRSSSESRGFEQHCGVPVHRLFSDQYEYQDFTDGKGACNSGMKTAPYETGIMLIELATITARRGLIETDRP